MLSGDAGPQLSELFNSSANDSCKVAEEEKMVHRMMQKMGRVYNPSTLARLMVRCQEWCYIMAVNVFGACFVRMYVHVCVCIWVEDGG